MKKKVQLQVRVKQVAFTKSNGWRIIKTGICDCFGVMPWDPKENETLDLTGYYKSKPNGDKEFHFNDVKVYIETDPRALLDLACEMTKGFGPSTADAIWDVYNKDWETATKLEGVGRIGPKNRAAWGEALCNLRIQREQMEAVAHLSSMGCTTKMATAAYKMWEKHTLAKVESNCFILAEIKGYGFASVDGDIRFNYGISDDDPRRFDAALVYVVQGLTKSNGNTIVQLFEVHDSLRELVNISESVLIESISRMVEDEKIIRMDPETIALFEDHQYEIEIYNFFKDAS